MNHSIDDVAKKISENCTLENIGSELGKRVKLICDGISDRIKDRSKPFHKGFLRKLPFTYNHNHLLYELQYLCIYAGHIEIQV